jgi:hypothetical protein
MENEFGPKGRERMLCFVNKVSNYLSNAEKKKKVVLDKEALNKSVLSKGRMNEAQVKAEANGEG